MLSHFRLCLPHHVVLSHLVSLSVLKCPSSYDISNTGLRAHPAPVKPHANELPPLPKSGHTLKDQELGFQYVLWGDKIQLIIGIFVKIRCLLWVGLFLDFLLYYWSFYVFIGLFVYSFVLTTLSELL